MCKHTLDKRSCVGYMNRTNKYSSIFKSAKSVLTLTKLGRPNTDYNVKVPIMTTLA